MVCAAMLGGDRGHQRNPCTWACNTMTRRAGLHGLDPPLCAVQEMQVLYCAADLKRSESLGCQGAVVVMPPAFLLLIEAQLQARAYRMKINKSEENTHRLVTV